jgi:hypothetical protein
MADNWNVSKYLMKTVGFLFGFYLVIHIFNLNLGYAILANIILTVFLLKSVKNIYQADGNPNKILKFAALSNLGDGAIFVCALLLYFISRLFELNQAISHSNSYLILTGPLTTAVLFLSFFPIYYNHSRHQSGKNS